MVDRKNFVEASWTILRISCLDLMDTNADLEPIIVKRRALNVKGFINIAGISFGNLD